MVGASDEGTADTRPRPPEGDWLGTPYLRFERHGPLARCVVDRPEARNAMTAAMYFGVCVTPRRPRRRPRRAAHHRHRRRVHPGGDLSGNHVDGWADLPRLLFMDNTPFDALRQATKPVVTAVNGICQGGGLVIAMLSDVAVVSDRATFRVPELYRASPTPTTPRSWRGRSARPARTSCSPGARSTPPKRSSGGSSPGVVPHDDLLDAATEALVACCRTAPDARNDIKRSLDSYYGLYDRIGMAASLRSPETAEGYLAFKERRAPSWIHPDLRPEGRL